MSSFCKDIEPSNVLDELKNCQDDVPIFRRLINIAPTYDSSVIKSVKEWQPVLTHIVQLMSSNTELGNERILLACHAFHVLLSTRCNLQFLEDTIMLFQELDSCNLCFLKRQYTISDLELFKLLNAHGYLQVNRKNIYFDHALFTMFDVLYRNCLRYTRYSYYAYKVLYMWLKRTSNTRFWQSNNIILEQMLEAIIFSNWSNVLNDICKQNAQIFNLYLRIMSEKYSGFLENIFETCVKNISWQNETKYTILVEVCQIWDNIQAMTTEDFLFGLFTSLTKNSLRSGGTKLYLLILRKLSEYEWKKTFGNIVIHFIDRWEWNKYKDHNALQSLFKYWLEPTIEIYRDILIFLWKLCNHFQYFSCSYLQMIAAKFHVELPQMHNIDCLINNREEIVRLNGFAVLCHHVIIDLIDVNKTDSFFLIKQFLWFNANAATVFLREGIIKYFKILFSNILKINNTNPHCAQSICEFIEWLYEYFLDCFEIGSCYQCKILALNLYKTVLSFTNGNLHKNCTHHRECLRNIATIDKYLKTTNRWKFTDKKSAFILLRLILDPALDIRQLATILILEYFEKDVLSAVEKCVLYNCAWEHCNSSKFYKIESGAALMKIIAHWSFLSLDEIYENSTIILHINEHNNILACSSYSEFLLNEARYQLAEMKKDILKAIVQNRPFYGVLTALLEVAFRTGPENWILSSQFMVDVLHFLKDAVNFFLSTLSTKTSSTAYSSSFAEMGLAIDEKIKTSEINNYNYDELQLSPAHLVLISCIWMSLKVSCEIVSEIGILMQTDTEVRYAMDIIVTVLMKCRHKGAVESAGVAIANLSRHLYNKKEYCELPKIYLMSLLKEDMGKLLHLTRRGAGLSIMFHKLVVSDNRRDRPIVHFAVQMLLRSLANFSAVAIRNIESGQDSPWAKRLYFLRALVADKEIRPQLIPYMENICLTCFEYMKSDVWTVRNASLQLYGAVVPRLVGQCSGKKNGAPDFGDGYSINHFITHYPTLATHVWKQLQVVSRIRGTTSEALRSYANVEHMLILLSKMWMGGCDLVDYPSQIFAMTMKNLLREFLINPMMHVRQLAAKTYAALTPSANVYLELSTLKRDIFSHCDNNLSHGSLLTVGYLREGLINDMGNSNLLCKMTERCTVLESYIHLLRRQSKVLNVWRNIYKDKKAYVQPCYMLEILFFQELEFLTDRIVFSDKLAFNNSLSAIKHIASSQKIQPGFFQFVGLWARLYAMHIEETSNIDLEIIRRVLNSNCIEQNIGFLDGLPHCTYLLEFILKYLISLKNNHHQLLLDEIAAFTLRTLKHANLSRINETEFEEIIEGFNKIKTTIARNWNVIRVKNALILAFSKREALINEVLSYVLRISVDDKESVRWIAAEYVELALRRFVRLGSDNRLTIMQCCLILLKDEIAEIRDFVSMSLQHHAFCDDADSASLHRLQHEEIIYQRLLRDIICHRSVNTVSITNSADFIRYFTRALRDTDSDMTIENPFYHDDITFYKVESKFFNLCFLYTKLEKNDNFLSNNENIYKNYRDAIYAIQVKYELQKKVGFNNGDLKTVLYLREIDYLLRKRNVIYQQN